MKHQIHFLTNLGGMLRSMTSAIMFVAVFMLSLPHTAVADDWVPTTDNGGVTYTGETITVTVDNLETNGHWGFFVIQLSNNRYDGGTTVLKFEKKNGGYYFNDKNIGSSFFYSDKYVVDGIGQIDLKTGYGEYYYNMLITISLVNQWKNCTIGLKAGGEWINSSGGTEDHVHTSTFVNTFQHTVRPIDWNDDGLSVKPDGTMTVLYAFSQDACNTDGDTHISTLIDDNKSSAIGDIQLANYNNGSYSFGLSDIGKSLRSTFTITPCHIFTHNHDADGWGGDGSKDYIQQAATKTFLPLPKANITQATFNQTDKNVVLKWSPDNANYTTGKWVIWRGDTKAGVVSNSSATEFTFVDTDFEYETTHNYTVCYIMDATGWDEDTRVAELTSQAVAVNTTRTLSINNFNAESQADRIVLTWQSDSLPADWGHQFNIYIDDETSPVCTVIPDNNEVSFRWEHRSTRQHSNRQNGIDGHIRYTEEPLNGTIPHNYRVKAVIDDKTFTTVTATDLGILSATQFYYLDVTKGAYPGTIKLAWRVDQQGSSAAKDYVVERAIAGNENQQWVHIWSTSTSEEYIYYNDDTPLPGVFYEYRVTVTDKGIDGKEIKSSITGVGFAKTTGIVSGRVTFGSSGMAVADVDVIAKQTSAADNSAKLHSIRLNSSESAAKWLYPSVEYVDSIFRGSPFTIQLWVNPDAISDVDIVQINGNTVGAPWFHGPCIRTDRKGQLGLKDVQNWFGSDQQLKVGQYNHITVTCDNDTLTFYVISDENEVKELHGSSVKVDRSGWHLSNADGLAIGGFVGYIDEFRLWTRCLTPEEILENYDHLLVGNEEDLETYWTFDEGLNSQFFDYSRSGTVYHSHHGRIEGDAHVDTYTPEHLMLKAKTDNDGNYLIPGIPFTGEGTTYAIIPQLGEHTFNPTQHLCYISNNSLVHSSRDFDDISSFTVTGAVYYEGTDYPVDSCMLYVDGAVCAKDGAPIMTDVDGAFTISVPIGEHFIQVKKNGHEFVNNGRYPADNNELGQRVNFNKPMANLTFYDKTLVNLTGRVVGGSIEGDKPVGFGESSNNIGVASITLTPHNSQKYRINVKEVQEGTMYDIVPNDTARPVESATSAIHSTAWRGAGNQCNKFFIRTDSATGEFSAMVPPLFYTIDSIRIASSNMNLIQEGIAVDMTNPSVEYQDSTETDNGQMKYYEYHSVLRQTYHSSPIFTVEQDDNEIGAFGIQSYKIQDGFGDLTISNIYSADETGKITYKYGAPLFEMEDFYTFNIKGYEEYVNRDKSDNIKVTQVPLEGVVVTINNALSSDQAVYGENNPDNAPAGSVYNLQSNQLTLDADGEAAYEWMAGLPNITSPYTRSIDITYEVDGVEYAWSGNSLKGIILGDLPTGNNFVTAGPDFVDMVLRDPPGSQSFATWEKGSVTNFEIVRGRVFEGEEAGGACIHSGATVTVGAGMGVFTVSTHKFVADVEAGYQSKFDKWYGKTARITTTITKAISTSNLPEYDGADGDVFIGRATNLIFGKSRQVGLFRDPANSSNAVINLKDALSVGSSFKTSFAYTQHYIVHDLLPNLIKMRNGKLTSVNQYTPDSLFTGNVPVYETKYKEGDAKFGTDGSYKMFKPKNYNGIDTIQYLNSAIKSWKEYLADNEFDKILAFERKSSSTQLDYTNYSFDAGSSISISKTQETSQGIHTEKSYRHGFYLNGALGGTANDWGIEFHWNTTNVWGRKLELDEDTTDIATFSYTLKDDDPDDAISVDVYDFKRETISYYEWKELHPNDTTYDSLIEKIKKNTKGAKKDTVIITKTGIGKYASPIFRTRGGQTSNPYEGKVEVQYDNSHLGQTIMEATMQVEVPQIEAVPARRVNVTSGTAANFSLELRNASEVDADCVFKLFMDDNTNPNGAQLLIDGLPLTDGRLFRVPAGQTVYKSLQLKQSDLSILEYNNIGIILASVGQSDPMSKMPVIADTTYITAHFVASSSPVKMALNTTTINAEETGTDLLITMSDFDRNFYNLKAFRLQYKPQGGNWNTFHEYVLNESDNTGSNTEMLPDASSVTYTLPMESFIDGNYTFRIVSASKHGTSGEVLVYSNEVALVKDTDKPKPLGLPEPADGVLDIGDEISITFNEPILRGELTELNNFRITGVLNGIPVEHHVALQANENIDTPAAQTEASFNLSKHDFSLDAWFYITSAGTILRHGAGSHTLTIGTNEAGQAVIGLGSETYTSEEALPRNKWVFFTLSYSAEADHGILSAAAAQGETEWQLIHRLVPRYEGNGPICIGCGAGVAVHEVLLWDNTRELALALAQRDITKNPATRHLAGCWKMNEGEGTFIRDYSRNRHMRMHGETWYLNNINKAIALDGTQHIAMCTANVPPTRSDDYAVEFWMKAGAQTDTATLFRLGEVSMWLAPNGQLYLQSGEQSYLVNRPIVNNEWHHVALNVLRLGSAAVYIDGTRALTLNASSIGDFASDSLRMGEHLVGAIDEVRLWHATMSADLLAANRRVRLNGDEPGLSLYYPFEVKSLDGSHQIVVDGTLDEQSIDDKGKPHGTPAVIANSLFTDDAPALREHFTEVNVPFKFTASDNKIVISLDASAAQIEGCTLHFTVRNAHDVNGNRSTDAVWSAFVHRRALVWGDEELNATQPVKSSTTVSTTISNRTGAAQMWEITNIPSWLIVSPSSGTLNPLEQVTVTFTTDEATAIGHYEQTLYLATTDSIEQPLAVRLKVTGNAPEWSVNPNDYDMSMNIIGQLDIFGLIAEDEEDLVAAFINDTCRGVAHPTYKARYDGYYITMDVYGTAADNDKELSFRAYDASTGVLYPLVEPDREIKFTAPALVGSYAAPVKLSVSDKIEQTTLLKRGWNWLSLYVQTEDMHPKTLLEPIAEDVKQIKGHSNLEGVLMRDKDGWSGNMDTLRNSKMYLIQMENDRTLRLVGKRIDPQNCLVNLANGWTWAGYYGRQISSVTDALSGMDPQDGDILKGQRGIAYYDDYEWAGSLAFMEPGLGYMIYNTAADKSFAYPFVTVAMAPRRAPITNHKSQTDFTPVDYHQFDGNMTLIAQLLKDGQPLPNTELGIFAGDECRAVAVSDDEGKFITLIPGDETVTLSFKVAVGEEILEASQTLEYVTNATAGTTEQPLLITFGSVTAGVGEGQITNDQSQTTNAHKELRHGILYILRNGKTYNAQGAEVK